MTKQTEQYYSDLSFIQNSDHSLTANTDIMTITGFMNFEEKSKHIVRYCQYLLEDNADEKTLRILQKYSDN